MHKQKSSVCEPLDRRDVLRAVAVGAAAAAAGVSTFADVGTAAVTSGTWTGAGIRAFKLYTGPDNASHLLKAR